MAGQTYTFDLSEGTLSELRAFIAETQHMPGSSRVVARIGFGKGSRHGSRVKSITAETPRDTP